MQNKAKDTYIFVYGSLRAGGIETLISRINLYASNNDIDVHIVLTDPIVNDCQFTSGIPFFSFFDDRFQIHQELRKFILCNINSNFCIVTMESGGAAIAATLELFIKKNGGASKHATGFFHPNAYFMRGEVLTRKIINWIIGWMFHENQIFFMNHETKNSHKLFFCRSMAGSGVVPLPLLPAAFIKLTGGRICWRILTIGRLVPFKAYNLGIPLIARNLIDAGIKLEWDIYGSGPLEPAIHREITRLGLEGCVTLRGEIAYDSMRNSFLNYDVFVGQGTSALEAAQHGLPALCAIVDSATLTYGFIHELPFGNVGEVIPGRLAQSIESRLNDLFFRADHSLRQASIDAHIYTEKYSFEEFFMALSYKKMHESSNLSIKVRSHIGLFLAKLHGPGGSSLRRLIRVWAREHVVRAGRGTSR